MASSHHQKKLLNSFVTLALGITFTAILIFIAWRDSIQSQARDFSLASSTVKNAVARNAQTANDTLNSFSTYLEVNPDLSEEEFSLITTSVLGLYPFLESTVYVTYNDDYSDPERPYAIKYQTLKGDIARTAERELLSNEAYESAIELLFNSDSVITLGSELNRNNWQGFWILKAVKPVSKIEEGKGNFGFAAILINSNILVGPVYENTGLALFLLSDSASLSGRSLLHEYEPTTEQGWMGSVLLLRKASLNFHFIQSGYY